MWETVPEMESLNDRAAEQDTGAITLVLDVAKALEHVGRFLGWATPASAFRVLRASEETSN